MSKNDAPRTIQPDVCKFVAKWESTAPGPGYVVRREWSKAREVVAQFVEFDDALEYAAARNATRGRVAGNRGFPTAK